MFIEVLPEDIKEAHYGNPHDCAIARAVRRRLKPEFDVSLGSDSFVITMKRVYRGEIKDGQGLEAYQKQNTQGFTLNIEIPDVYLLKESEAN